MRKANVFVHDQWAGILTEDESGYHFQYRKEYMEGKKSDAISLTMPFQQEEYYSKTFFPFFDGLIPEGWLLEIAENNWKLNPRDRMGLLLETCHDCIGSVSIRSVKKNNK